MNWKKWRLGACVSLFMSLLVAGAGMADGMSWRSFFTVFCAAAVTHFGAFLYQHPVEKIEFAHSATTETGNTTQNTV